MVVFKILKRTQVIIVLLLAAYALFVRYGGQNPVDDILFGAKSQNIRLLSYKPQKNTLNKLDNSIETEDGILEIGNVRFYKDTVSVVGEPKGTAMVVDYAFTPKRSGVKVNKLFEQVVKVEQTNEDGTPKAPEPANFFGDTIDKTIVDKTNKGVAVVTDSEVGQKLEAAAAYTVVFGEVRISYGQTTTPYFVSE